MTAMTTARPRSAGTSDHDQAIDRLPPYDKSAEAGVLGSIIIDPAVLSSVRRIIPTPDAFFGEENAIIYRVICEMDTNRVHIDHVTIRSTLKTKNLMDQVGGVEYVKELASAVPISTHANSYAAIVWQKYQIRRLISACASTLRDCYESGDHEGDLLERASGRLLKITDDRATDYPVPMSQVVPDVVMELDTPAARATMSGIHTGFTELDILLGGMFNGDMIVVGARPSTGKSAFALNILEHVAIDQRRACAIFSLEMKKEQLAIRSICAQAFVDSYKLKQGRLNNEERGRVAIAAARAASDLLFVDDSSSMTLSELRSKAIWLKKRYGLELLAIDYLGLMRGERRENRTDEVRVLSAGVKQLARELNIPILLLSQLNRECESEGRKPRKSDLRSSGDIEQDADVIILLHREITYHRGDQQWIDANQSKTWEAEAIVEKQRNGACATVQLKFLPECTRFVNPGF
jgi:replicative DNA helicase